ncbi:OLC1v1034965C1 [Oldenlandia corymbosa var. corymbosa]|uniref:OLC1v1034965C1 n=1 Tax=Oldenlandia corymbosa var. corymbosa TaxID=529605 RepID=A0AAV1CUY8_OLDCO|nr:OLC1v1034965C1 [Oldenlandia corymbosa var. corymbosa]
MTKVADEFESWLLPQFLIDDDDVFSEWRGSEKINGGRNGVTASFGMGLNQKFGGGFGEFGPCGSPEMETDDDDYVAELSRIWSNSSLRVSSTAYESKMGWGLSGSPESTLSGGLGGGECRCIRCSSRKSPTSLSQVTSPTGMNGIETAWELLCAAAGEIARLRMAEEVTGFHLKSINGGRIVPIPRKPTPVSVPQKNSAGLSYQNQVKALQFQLLREQQMSEKKFQLTQTQGKLLNNGGRKPNISTGVSGWPSFEQTRRQQQEAGSGMRTVFPGNPVSKTSRAGTGVFLPRRTGVSAPGSKKPATAASSTVLLEDRVVQTRNLEAMNSPAQPKYEAEGARYRSGRMMSQQGSSNVKQFPVKMKQSQEIQLPQEWTY